MARFYIDTSPLLELIESVNDIAKFMLAARDAWQAIQTKIPIYNRSTKTWVCPVCDAYHASRAPFEHYEHCPMLKLDRAQAKIIEALSRSIPSEAHQAATEVDNGSSNPV